MFIITNPFSTRTPCCSTSFAQIGQTSREHLPCFKFLQVNPEGGNRNKIKEDKERINVCWC